MINKSNEYSESNLEKRIEELEQRVRLCELYNDELDMKVRLINKKSLVQGLKKYRLFNVLLGMTKDRVWARQVIFKALSNPKAAYLKIKKKQKEN